MSIAFRRDNASAMPGKLSTSYCYPSVDSARRPLIGLGFCPGSHWAKYLSPPHHQAQLHGHSFPAQSHSTVWGKSASSSPKVRRITPHSVLCLKLFQRIIDPLDSLLRVCSDPATSPEFYCHLLQKQIRHTSQAGVIIKHLLFLGYCGISPSRRLNHH